MTDQSSETCVLSVKRFLESEDPLQDAAFLYLVEHKEEDVLVDYKRSFEPSSEKSWVDLAVDVMAFANTYGGYLLFGIEDVSFEKLGVSEATVKALTDIDELSQRCGRSIEPKFNSLRSKRFTLNGMTFCLVFIPETKGQTHIFVREDGYNLPSGQRKISVAKGGIFYRASGGNRHLDPQGLQMIIDKRIEYFKQTLLENICKVVVKSKPDEVVVVNSFNSKDALKVRVSSDSDALPIVGMPIGKTPETDEELVATWFAASTRDPKFLPSESMLWELYSRREATKLQGPHLVYLAKVYLCSAMPAFYFMRTLKYKEISDICASILSEHRANDVVSSVIRTSAFLGPKTYQRTLRRLGKATKNLDPALLSHRGVNPSSLFSPGLIEARRRFFQKSRGKNFDDELCRELNEITTSLARSTNDIEKKYNARAIDCFLYARGVQNKTNNTLNKTQGLSEELDSDFEDRSD